MARKLTRREALKLAVLGGLGGLAAACAPSTRVTPPMVPTRSLPTSTPAANLSGGNVPASTAIPTEAPPATAVASAPATETPQLASDMALKATQFIDLLDEGQRTKATYAFADSERTRWHWTTPRNAPRNGLPLREMATDQRDQALEIGRASCRERVFGLV